MLALAAALTTRMYAHHSFSAHYFEDRTISVEGEVVKFDYRSPHAWIHVTTKDDKGQTLQYAAEWSNPSRLKKQGITPTTIKPGDYVILIGSPGRNPTEQKLHLKGIQRPSDGWKSGASVGRTAATWPKWPMVRALYEVM
jgi:hypothetical protein